MLSPITNNPKLSILMVILVLSGAIVANPSLIAFLPDGAENYVKGVAGLISVVAAVLGFSSTPNKKNDENSEK